MSDTYVKIIEDGRMFKVTVTRTEITTTDGIMDRLTTNAPRRMRNVFKLDRLGTYANVVQKETFYYVSSPLNPLVLRCPFHVLTDGTKKILVPNLGAVEDPVLTLKWIPPSGMRLFLLFEAQLRTAVDYQIAQTWLFALAADNNVYKLPLGNLYDDCKICTGRDSFIASSLQEVVEQAYQQIENSVWNADLWRLVTECQRMFRFRPDNASFQQLPPDGTWTSLCRKVSVATYSFLLL